MTTTFDAIGRVLFGDATHSKVLVTCYGPQSGPFPAGGFTLTIPAGTVLAVVGTGAQFTNLVDLVSAPATGFGYLSVTGEFVAASPGPILAPAGDVSVIITPVAGLDSVSNAAGQSSIGALVSDEGDGSPDFTGAAMEPIEAEKSGLLFPVPSLVQTQITHTAIGPVLYWNGSAYALEGDGHLAIVPLDSVEDQPGIIGRMVPLSSNPAVGGDATVPVISNITPAAEHAITPQDVLGFDVTDAGGNLQRTTVLAYFRDGLGPGLPIFEVVYFGSSVGDFSAGFAPGYTGLRTAITNGFRFSQVYRSGGWPSSPTLIADAGDSAGNESA